MTSLPWHRNWNLFPSTLHYKKKDSPKGPCKLRMRLGKPFLSQLQKRTAENPLVSASGEGWSWFGRAGCKAWVTFASSASVAVLFAAARRCSSPATSTLPLPGTWAEVMRRSSVPTGDLAYWPDKWRICTCSQLLCSINSQVKSRP